MTVASGATKGGAKPPAKQGSGKPGATRPGAKKAPAKKSMRVSGGLVALASATLVIVVVGIIVAIKLTGGNGGKGSPAVAAPTDVVQAATNVPTSVLSTVGLAQSAVTGIPLQIKGTRPPALTLNGKPEVLYIGAEFCPYCAAERWSMVVALSRFGTFSGLKTTHSSTLTGEQYPNTQTFSFLSSAYTSNYLSFVPVETYTNQYDAATRYYTPLQSPTAAQNKLIAKFDVPPYDGPASSTSKANHPIPFIDLGNRYIAAGAAFSPQVLQGLSLGTIAGSLSVANSPVAQAIDGGANYFTATLCELTHNQPTEVCSGPVIKAAQATLAKTT